MIRRQPHNQPTPSAGNLQPPTSLSDNASHYPRSPNTDGLAGNCSGNVSVIPKGLKELADQETAHKLKCRQMISKREIHDAEMEQRHTEEDGKVCSDSC